MIEVNTKAKQMNEADSVLGLELFLFLVRPRLVGDWYYNPNPNKENGKEVLALTKSWPSAVNKVVAAGWKVFEEHIGFTTFKKGKDTLCLAHTRHEYNDMVMINEIIKYVGIYDAAVVGGIKDIMINDHKAVWIKNDGKITEIGTVKAEPDFYAKADWLGAAQAQVAPVQPGVLAGFEAAIQQVVLDDVDALVGGNNNA